MSRERKEDARRVNRKRSVRKTGQIGRKMIPNSAHVRAKKKTMFNCFNAGTQGTLIRCNSVPSSF